MLWCISGERCLVCGLSGLEEAAVLLCLRYHWVERQPCLRCVEDDIPFCCDGEYDSLGQYMVLERSENWFLFNNNSGKKYCRGVVYLGLSDVVSSSVSYTGVELGSAFVWSGVKTSTVVMVDPWSGRTDSVCISVSTWGSLMPLNCWLCHYGQWGQHITYFQNHLHLVLVTWCLVSQAVSGARCLESE